MMFVRSCTMSPKGFKLSPTLEGSGAPSWRTALAGAAEQVLARIAVMTANPNFILNEYTMAVVFLTANEAC